MKNLKFVLCLSLAVMLCLSSVMGVFAAYDSQISDVEDICDLAIDYVNEGNKEKFLTYMASELETMFGENGADRSGKFVFLYSEDPSLSDEDNQLTKLVMVLDSLYVKGKDMELKQSDINKNVTPGYPETTGVDDYEADDAEAFMEIINDGLSRINTVKADEKDTPEKNEKDNAMPPEKNEEKKKEEDNKSEGGASVGVVIFISILVSAIVFAAGVYATKQLDAKKREDAGNDVDNDDIFNLRLAVKSMQSSLQKADGNFKELDKLRIQVDEMDEKLESIAEYLRRMNKAE